MAQIHWSKSVSGAFGDGGDWIGGRVPGAGDDALLDAPGSTAYAVTAGASVTVASVETAATAMLDILADFSATEGTGAGENAGAIRIENGHTLTLQGTVDNTGSIEIFGTVSTTSIVLGAGGVTLKGGGAVFLNFTGGAHQQIVAAPGGSVLTLHQRISGQGFIGGDGLSIDSEADGGFLEAKGGLLTIDTGERTIMNAGLIDAEGAPSYPYVAGQGVVLSPVQNDGIVEADGGGSTMTFEGPVTGSGRGVITGGILRFNAAFNQNVGFTRSTGALFLAHAWTYTSLITGYSPSGGEFFDLGDIDFVSAGEATFSGSANGGLLTITDGVHKASLRLSGNFLASAFTARSDGAGGTLVTDGPKAIDWASATSGSFQTGADWTGGVAPGPNNDAILGADGGASYTVTASGAQLAAGITLASNATLYVSGAFTATHGGDGGIVAGRIAIANDGALITAGTLGGSCVITLAATTGKAKLVIADALTLSGGGTLSTSDSAFNAIFGAAADSVLTNVDKLVAAAGNIGVGRLTLINQAHGRIVSNRSANGLIINTGPNVVINAGLIEGAGAGLRVFSAIENDGVVEAVTTLTFSRAVTGSGRAVITGGGTLQSLANFDQIVSFVGAGGGLTLAQSRFYDQTLYGFSASGRDKLDLRDVKFIGADEATFSGAPAGGVLTVGDGRTTARINLRGDYTNVIFTASDDGQGGTMVTDRAKSLQAAHAFAAAMAGEAAPSSPAVVSARTPAPPMILAPGH